MASERSELSRKEISVNVLADPVGSTPGGEWETTRQKVGSVPLSRREALGLERLVLLLVAVLDEGHLLVDVVQPGNEAEGLARVLATDEYV